MTFKKLEKVGFSVFLFIALSLVCYQIPKQCYGEDEIRIGIDLSQSIINLQSSISIITFHTSIKAYEVDCATVTLTADTEQPVTVPVYRCASDSRGNFLADFLMQQIKDIKDNLEIGEENLFILEGKTRDGIPFYGSQWILAVDNKPKGR